MVPGSLRLVMVGLIPYTGDCNEPKASLIALNLVLGLKLFLRGSQILKLSVF